MKNFEFDNPGPMYNVSFKNFFVYSQNGHHPLEINHFFFHLSFQLNLHFKVVTRC
jgi:hypothetical protein